MFTFSANNTGVILAKAFAESDVQKIVDAITLYKECKKILVVDHPPTPALNALLTALADKMFVHYRDHHLSEKTMYPVMPANVQAVVVTREQHPSCSTLVSDGEFKGHIVLADEDLDGFLSAMKAVGVSYPELDSDAAILDGPVSEMTENNLSHLGFLLMKAWKGLPGHQDPTRQIEINKIVSGYFEAAKSGLFQELGALSYDFDRKVEATHVLFKCARIESSGYRMISIETNDVFDPVTLAQLMDEGVPVSGRIIKTGPISKVHGSQISLARTKSGEHLIDFQHLVEKAFGPKTDAWGPEFGIISNTPFLIHLSLTRWIEFKPVLDEELRQK